MFKLLSAKTQSFHRLLLAAVVVVAPFCADLPCCCERAAAAGETSCCSEATSNSSCCKTKSPATKNSASNKTSGTEGATCCLGRNVNDSHKPAQGDRLSGCECCFEESGHQPVTLLTVRGNSVVSDDCFQACFSDEWRLAFISQESQDSPDVVVPQVSHNRHQAILCVWRN